MTSKRKICIITGGHWSAVRGGVPYQAKCLVEELAEINEFSTTYLARVVNNEYTPSGYMIKQISKPNRINRYGFFFDTIKLLKLLHEIKPDVIYQRGLKSYNGIAAYYSKNNKCKFIFHIAHDYDVVPFKTRASGSYFQVFFELLEKKFGVYGIKNADYIIAQSFNQARLLKKYYKRSVEVVIPNFHPLPKEKINKDIQPIKIIWVANFKKFKRPEIFVQLAEDLQGEKMAEFIMIGRFGGEKKYGELFKKISKLQNIKYFGEKSIHEINEILAKSHIFVNTSVAEGFPNTFIQAWMRKVPVVSLSVNPDGIFNNKEVGFCDGDYEMMKKSIKGLVNDSELRQKMGENAQKYAFQNHSMMNAEKLISIMKKR